MHSLGHSLCFVSILTWSLTCHGLSIFMYVKCNYLGNRVCDACMYTFNILGARHSSPYPNCPTACNWRARTGHALYPSAVFEVSIHLAAWGRDSQAKKLDTSPVHVSHLLVHESEQIEKARSKTGWVGWWEKLTLATDRYHKETWTTCTHAHLSWPLSLRRPFIC